MPNSGASDIGSDPTFGIAPVLIARTGAPVGTDDRVDPSVRCADAFLSQLERRLPRTIFMVAPLRED